MNTPAPFPLPGQRSPVAKGFRAGTHRQFDPSATLARIQRYFATTGITRVANVTGLDRIGIPVVMVCRPNSRSVAVSQGKGLTLATAKVSGIMESLELWHAERLTLPLILASYRELCGSYHVINVERLARQARSRFRPELQMLWISGRELISGETTWVPYECVTMNATLPQSTGSGCFLGTSNGLASGNDLFEALSHAICEVVERDASTLWHVRGESERPERLIDLDTVDDPSCREVIDRCREAGVKMLAWNITSDVGLAAFAALITDPESPQATRSTAIGYGCHSDRGIALLRAMTEAVQSRLTYIAGSRDDLFRREYEDNLRTRASVERFHELLRVKPAQRFQDVVSRDSDFFDEDVACEICQLQRAGIHEVVAIELTDPRIGIPIVRVVVPGLEGPDSDPDYERGARAIAAAAEVEEQRRS